jgi:TRAP-type C4-dicarboxylate transport system substrate-binding protein
MKKKTRFLWVFLVVLCILGWGLSKQAIAGDQAFQTLKLTTLYIEGQELYETVKFFSNEVEKRTQGKIKFRIFAGSSLVPTNQFVTSVDKGVVDSAFAVPGYEQGLWPITASTYTFGAPNITYKKWRTVHDQVRDILNKNLNLNVVILSMPHVCNYALYSRKPLTGKVDDFKGLLLRGAGGSFDISLKAFGSSPVAIPAPEVYMALQKGTIDGAITIYSRYIEGKMYEVAPYFVVIPEGMTVCLQYFIINKGLWNSLTPDIQKVLLEVGTKTVAFCNDRSEASDKKIVAEILPKLGIKIVTMSAEENKILLQKLVTVYHAEVSKLGKPAEEIAKIVGAK